MKIESVILLIAFITNIFLIAPTVGVGDTAELAGAAVNYGIAHSPGYPLFCNVYKIFSVIIPFAEKGYRLNITSAILGYLSIYIIWKIIIHITQNRILGIIGIVLFFSIDTVVKQNQISEVFALNNFIIAILTYFLEVSKFSVEKKFYIVMFLLGLGLGNQHIIIFFIPAVILWFLIKGKIFSYIRLQYRHKTFNTILFGVIFFLLGLSIYLYVPLRSLQQPLYDWEDPETFDRFIFLFTRGRYGTFSLAQGGKLSITFLKFLYGIKLFFYILGWYVTIFFLVGVVLLLFQFVNKKVKFLETKLFCLTATYFLGPWIITISGLNVPTPHTVYILERLIFSSTIFVVMFITVSLYEIANRKLINYSIMCFLSYFVVMNFLTNFSRNDFFLYDYISNFFRNIPYNSLVFSDKADESEFGFAYFQRILGLRKDVEFIDCNASVSRSIYGVEYYRIWGKPRLEIRTAVETKIINSVTKPVFYNTLLPEQTGIKKYKFGLLYSTNQRKEKIYDEYFVFREMNILQPRVLGLYLTYLNSLAQYFLELAQQQREFVFKAKDKFFELFLITKDIKYMLYIPYYFFSIGELKSAQEEYIKLLKYPMDKENAKEIMNNIGVVYENQGEFYEAEKWYKKVLELDPEFEKAYYNLAVVYWKIGRYKDAIKMFTKVVQLNPQNVEAKKYLVVLKQKI